MLEPAVRPGGVSRVAPDRAGSAPFEARPFEQLLQEAQQQTDPGSVEDAKSPAAQPLDALADFTRIENASVRQQLEAARHAGPTQPDSMDTTESHTVTH